MDDTQSSYAQDSTLDETQSVAPSVGEIVLYTQTVQQLFKFVTETGIDEATKEEVDLGLLYLCQVKYVPIPGAKSEKDDYMTSYTVHVWGTFDTEYTIPDRFANVDDDGKAVQLEAVKGATVLEVPEDGGEVVQYLENLRIDELTVDLFPKQGTWSEEEIREHQEDGVAPTMAWLSYIRGTHDTRVEPREIMGNLFALQPAPKNGGPVDTEEEEDKSDDEDLEGGGQPIKNEPWSGWSLNIPPTKENNREKNLVYTLVEKDTNKEGDGEGKPKTTPANPDMAVQVQANALDNEKHWMLMKSEHDGQYGEHSIYGEVVPEKELWKRYEKNKSKRVKTVTLFTQSDSDPPKYLFWCQPSDAKTRYIRFFWASNPITQVNLNKILMNFISTVDNADAEEEIKILGDVLGETVVELLPESHYLKFRNALAKQNRKITGTVRQSYIALKKRGTALGRQIATTTTRSVPRILDLVSRKKRTDIAEDGSFATPLGSLIPPDASGVDQAPVVDQPQQFEVEELPDDTLPNVELPEGANAAQNAPNAQNEGGRGEHADYHHERRRRHHSASRSGGSRRSAHRSSRRWD